MNIERCPLCQGYIEPWEEEPDADANGVVAIRPDGAGVCSECYAKWHDYDVLRRRNGILETLLLDSRDARKMERALLDAETAKKMVDAIQDVLNRAGSIRSTVKLG